MSLPRKSCAVAGEMMVIAIANAATLSLVLTKIVGWPKALARCLDRVGALRAFARRSNHVAETQVGGHRRAMLCPNRNASAAPLPTLRSSTQSYSFNSFFAF